MFGGGYASSASHITAANAAAANNRVVNMGLSVSWFSRGFVLAACQSEAAKARA
jgi:hypothetical protein